MSGPSRPIAPYLAAFVALGLATTVLGPAVGQLRQQTGATVAALAIAFAAQSFGYLIASILAGRRFDADAGHRLLAGGLAALGLSGFGWAPSTSVAAVAGVAAAVGAAAAVVDVGANTLLVWARPGDPGPALNALHLCFGLGALAAPALVDRSIAWTSGLWAVAGVVAVPSIAVAAVLVRRPAPAAPPRPASGPSAGGLTARCGLAAFYVLYIGAELGVAGWIHTYAGAVGFGPAAATGVTATFWAGFCLGRLVAAAVVRRVGEIRLLVVSCALAALAAVGLLAGDGTPAAVWVGAGLFGATVSPQFPTMIAVADRRLGLTGSITAWIIAGTGLGSLTLPWLIGVLLDRAGARAMPATVAVLATASLVWAVVLTARLLPAGDQRPGRQPEGFSPS
jgi:FHS family Na+ dependent glucose MFS transporter 1